MPLECLKTALEALKIDIGYVGSQIRRNPAVEPLNRFRSRVFFYGNPTSLQYL
jgi:hypothetical protein